MAGGRTARVWRAGGRTAELLEFERLEVEWHKGWRSNGLRDGGQTSKWLKWLEAERLGAKRLESKCLRAERLEDERLEAE